MFGLPRTTPLGITLLLAAASACTEPASMSTQTESGTEEPGDGEPGDGDGEPGDGDGDPGDGDGDPGPETGPCFDGLDRWTFDSGASEVGYDLPAPDFSVETLRGPKTFSDFFNGCDNHVFVIYSANWWNTPVEPLVDDSAPNTQFWFVVPGTLGAEMNTGLVGGVAARVEAYLESLGPEAQAALSERFHYVIDSADDIPLVAGILAQNPGEEHFTVGRHQRVWEGHNVAVFNGAWTPMLAQTRYWSKYINAQYALDAELAEQEQTQDVLVHRVADGVEITGGQAYEWTLPDAETLAAYDRLEIDMHIDCPGAGHPYGATCGEWDTVGSIFLCAEPECLPENRRRVVKWITPYSSPGRWLIDITPELVHLAAGGPLTFISAHGDNDVGQYTYRYTVDLRLSQAEDGLRPIAIEELVPRGNYGWNDNFHTQWSDFAFVAPDGAQKAELYARISGHGAVDGSQCAEFCTFTHQFSVNGTAFAHEYLEENVDRCAEYVALGVTPNQGGTWFFDRSSWCPGWTIEEWRADLSGAVDFGGGDNQVVYDSWYGNNNPRPGGNMDMRVEVVFYGE